MTAVRSCIDNGIPVFIPDSAIPRKREGTDSSRMIVLIEGFSYSEAPRGLWRRKRLWENTRVGKDPSNLLGIASQRGRESGTDR
jgi:hypothetical protein